MPPPTDPAGIVPPPTDVARLQAAIERLREQLLNPQTDDPLRLSRFGWGVLDHLTLRPTDVLAAGGEGDVRRLYEEVGRRFLDHVLPSPEAVPSMDARHVTEYLSSVDPDRPDPSRLSGAFGAARLKWFGKDLRLVYRAAGYRGKPGDPLADHLIECVVRPLTSSAAFG